MRHIRNGMNWTGFLELPLIRSHVERYYLKSVLYAFDKLAYRKAHGKMNAPAHRRDTVRIVMTMSC
jgi:hypothetical protein